MSRPAAYFTNPKDARDAACAINDHLKTTFASYRRLADNVWVVEATSMTYADFVKRLAAAGCEGSVTPPEPER